MPNLIQIADEEDCFDYLPNLMVRCSCGCEAQMQFPFSLVICPACKNERYYASVETKGLWS